MIQRADCSDAARALSAIASREDLGNHETDERAFSRQGNGPLQFQMPLGYSYATCSLGIDMVDSRTRFSNWAFLKRYMNALLNQCVNDPESFVGGRLEVDGFVFIVINPTQLSVRGTCLDSRPEHALNLAQCVESALEGQRLREAFEKGRGQHVNPQTALNAQVRQHVEDSILWNDAKGRERRVRIDSVANDRTQEAGGPPSLDLPLPPSRSSLER